VTVTPLYASVLALMFIALSVRTLRLRRKLRIAVGDKGDQQMLRAMRAHANFAEYVPLSLLLIFMFEVRSGTSLLIHALCVCLIVGRFSHAYGLSRVEEDYRYRVFGMSMTFTALAVAAAGILAGPVWPTIA
jgi:uncharacterized membrane protein YecN with MAPEG domain